MKRLDVTAVRDLSFGRHDSRSFEGFDGRFVVVHGPNESGKSTLAEFLMWAIGGPFRTYANNSDAFRRGVDGVVRGRLLGTFDEQILDIDAQFKLLTKGLPNDNRKGAIGAAELDAAKLAERFGSLSSTDYELIYRLYGATLGDVGSAEYFSDVFSRFALGSASVSTNPRAILDGLNIRAKRASDRVRTLTTERNKKASEIRDASRAPEEIERLTGEVDSLNEQITEIEGLASAAAARVALYERVRDGLGHLDDLDRARGLLDEQESVSPEWESLVANENRVSELVTAVNKLQEELESAELRASASLGACGMTEGELHDFTLTPVERAELSTSVGAAIGARVAHTSTQNQLDGAITALDEAEADVARRAEALGLVESQLVHVDAIAETIPGLLGRASLWVDSVNQAIGLEAKVKGEEVGLNAPAAVTTGAARPTSVSPWLVIALLVAVGAIGTLHRVAGVAAAIFAAGAYFYLNSRRGSSVVPLVAPERVDDQVLASSRTRAAEERERARLNREQLERALGELSTVLSEPDTAASCLTQLGDLARARTHKMQCQAAVEKLQGQAETTLRDAVSKEKVALDLFAPRSIPHEMLGDGFDQWLAKYETAITSVAELRRLRSRLATVRSEWAEILKPVADEVVGVSPADVEVRLASVSRTLRDRHDAELKVRNAQSMVTAAKMDSPEVEQVLANHRTAAELQVVIDAAKSDIAVAKTQRDQLVERRLTATTLLNEKLGTEVLPALHLEFGRIEEEIEEAQRESAALVLAVSVLGDVIEGYERDNQDPVVSSASALISRVAPDWGTVLMSRNDKGNPVIERVGSDGRFEDSKISDGGRALLYMGIRLAFAQKDAERRGVSLPLICDDPFVHFDDERTEAGVRLLASVSAQNQVILMTCEAEVRDLAASLGASVVEM
jgi:uncharacterized protein YhaN